MRKLCLLAALCSPFAHADVVMVQANSLMRLPGNASVLQLEKLEVADYGTLLIPAGVTRVDIDQLHLGREARITLVPAEPGIELRVGRAEFDEGSQINARGAPGTFEKPARAARDLSVRIESLQAPQLLIDARGGTGAPGFSGLDGGNGQAPGCTWGAAGAGANGDDGGNGQAGAAGARVRVELPRDYPAELISVRVDGGAGGKPGEAGRAGAGGKSKGCIVYRTDGGKSGRPGLAGQPGDAGAAGMVTIERL
ncbi:MULTISPECIES: hypothetical protein [Pseudomonas]|jgi:hypothetical protein|uniref:hypothetical protein n=1 Tax=Pseudomonas TaxID=286 RepID=UPI000288EBB0|nr:MULTISPECIES: hypothetical protein [Pseudomonas]AMB81746.1 collagen pro alpha-chain precursor [Pseudomonas fragi]NBF14411.1 collagen-like protein [Pseudomonas sp. Fl4BN2]AUB74218.1 collagen pro alpha-chain precursor [Pseudomonas sp. Lz4W]MCH4869909.1 collagen-like protein [Pseudomonas sp. TMW22089]NBG91374.1 collagen-like protein [Pseudomonas sp. 9.1(2019)]